MHRQTPQASGHRWRERPPLAKGTGCTVDVPAHFPLTPRYLSRAHLHPHLAAHRFLPEHVDTAPVQLAHECLGGGGACQARNLDDEPLALGMDGDYNLPHARDCEWNHNEHRAGAAARNTPHPTAAAGRTGPARGAWAAGEGAAAGWGAGRASDDVVGRVLTASGELLASSSEAASAPSAAAADDWAAECSASEDMPSEVKPALMTAELKPPVSDLRDGRLKGLGALPLAAVFIMLVIPLPRPPSTTIRP
jgi:hypothetical protein